MEFSKNVTYCFQNQHNRHCLRELFWQSSHYAQRKGRIHAPHETLTVSTKKLLLQSRIHQLLIQGEARHWGPVFAFLMLLFYGSSYRGTGDGTYDKTATRRNARHRDAPALASNLANLFDNEITNLTNL